MEKEFIPYEQALALKELGFDEKCISVYLTHSKQPYPIYRPYTNNENTDEVLRPTFSQAFRFFREKYNLIPNIHSIYSDETHTEIKFWFWFGNYEDDSDDEVFYGTYEESELECLKKLIQIVKEQK